MSGTNHDPVTAVDALRRQVAARVLVVELPNGVRLYATDLRQEGSTLVLVAHELVEDTIAAGDQPNG